MNFKETPPTFIVNPMAAKKSLWFPKIFQLIRKHKNPSYLNSLWLGIGFNILILPHRLYKEFVMPMLHFKLIYCLIAVFVIPSSILLIAYYGITGRLMAVDIDFDVALDSMVMSPEQSLAAFKNGYVQMVIDARNLEPYTA